MLHWAAFGRPSCRLASVVYDRRFRPDKGLLHASEIVQCRDIERLLLKDHGDSRGRPRPRFGWIGHVHYIAQRREPSQPEQPPLGPMCDLDRDTHTEHTEPSISYPGR